MDGKERAEKRNTGGRKRKAKATGEMQRRKTKGGAFLFYIFLREHAKSQVIAKKHIPFLERGNLLKGRKIEKCKPLSFELRERPSTNNYTLPKVDDRKLLFFSISFNQSNTFFQMAPGAEFSQIYFFSRDSSF